MAEENLSLDEWLDWYDRDPKAANADGVTVDLPDSVNAAQYQRLAEADPKTAEGLHHQGRVRGLGEHEGPDPHSDLPRRDVTLSEYMQIMDTKPWLDGMVDFVVEVPDGGVDWETYKKVEKMDFQLAGAIYDRVDVPAHIAEQVPDKPDLEAARAERRRDLNRQIDEALSPDDVAPGDVRPEGTWRSWNEYLQATGRGATAQQRREARADFAAGRVHVPNHIAEAAGITRQPTSHDGQSAPAQETA